MQKIDEDLLSNVVAQELHAAETYTDSDLAREQAENLNYYYGKPFGDEQEGFSQVVSRDTLETIEGIMPELMKIFTSGDNFVEFEPEGADDIEAAQQTTDYINYIFQKRMNGFSIFYMWFKDALLMKNSVVKVGWEEKDCTKIHHFHGLTMSDIEILEDDEEVVVEEQTELEGEGYEGLYDVKVSRTVQKGQPTVEVIPSEDFKIKQRSVSIKEADFVAHTPDMTLGDLISMGYDKDVVMSLSSTEERVDDSIVPNARFQDPYEEERNLGYSSELNREVKLIDAYVQMFDEEDEVVKIYHVIQVGHTVLDYEVVESVPMISLAPIMMPHKFTGVAVADLVKDVQEIRSKLFRQTLDNLALTNSGRYSAVEGQVNLQDLIENKIGGVVRQKVQGAVSRLDTPQLSSATFPLLQQMEVERENRVGVSRMTQGLDPNALTSNTAATSVNQVMTAAQQKILLIARVFAETGVKELFWELYRLVRTHQTERDIVRLRGKFVAVRPFDWHDRYDMRVTVGIGNGNKDQQLYHLNNIRDMLQMIGNTQFGYMIQPKNVYNLALELINNSGYKNADLFITDPDTMEPPQPEPSPEMINAQTAQQKVQVDAQNDAKANKIKEGQLQLDAEEFNWKKKVDAAELGLEASQGRAVGIGDGK